IPYSFFDESHTNYSGARQALLQYEQSACNKRQALRQLLTNLTLWRLDLFVQDGTLILPDNLTLGDINFEWIAAGLPWIDPQKEATANDTLIKQRLKSRQEISKERGKDWFEIVDQIAAEEAYMQAKGIPPVETTTPVPVEPTDNSEGAQAA